MKDRTLKNLMLDIETAFKAKESAEKARINAEFKKKRAHYDYLSLMEMLRCNEFSIE